MNWMIFGSAIGALLLAVIKGLWGTDKPSVVTIHEITGLPLGPLIAERLNNMERKK